MAIWFSSRVLQYKYNTSHICNFKCSSRDIKMRKKKWVKLILIQFLFNQIYLKYHHFSREEVLPSVKIGLELEVIMFSEISQTEKDTAWYHLYVKPKKKVKLIETESRKVVGKGWRVGEIGRGREKGTNFQL